MSAAWATRTRTSTTTSWCAAASATPPSASRNSTSPSQGRGDRRRARRMGRHEIAGRAGGAHPRALSRLGGLRRRHDQRAVAPTRGHRSHGAGRAPQLKEKHHESRSLRDVHVAPGDAQDDQGLRQARRECRSQFDLDGRARGAVRQEHLRLSRLEGRPHPVPEGGGMLDVTATFGFLAAATTKLRLGTGVALVPQRNPIYTAKEMCTLDWLTDGRIDFGMGVGWNKEEVEACGYRWEDRGKRCDEFLEVMRRLWTEPVVDFSGKWVKFETMRHGSQADPEAARADHRRRLCRCRLRPRREVRRRLVRLQSRSDTRQADAGQARRRLRQGRPQARREVRDHHHAADEHGAGSREGICRPWASTA